MAVRIRLQRKGAKHTAFYRIVAADSRSPRDGRFIEQLGYYDPLKDPQEINVDTEKVLDWLGKGAQPSDTVRSLLARVGIMQTWHEMKKGKSLDELRHIEDEARKRIEAKSAMDMRKKEEEKKAKEKAAKKEQEKEAAAETPEPEVAEAGEEEAPAEPAAEEPEAGEPAVETPAESEVAPEAEDATAETEGDAEGDDSEEKS